MRESSAILCTVFLVGAVESQEIAYELADRSEIRVTSADGEVIRGRLRGTMRGVLLQSTHSVSVSFDDIDFVIEGTDRRLQGSGSLELVSPAMATKLTCLPSFKFTELTLRLDDEVEERAFFSELSGSRTFPAFVATYNFGTMTIWAAPVETEWRKFFRRGDANSDGSIDISDSIPILLDAFFGNAAVSCEDASDVNDDGGIGVDDAVLLLGCLFLSGTELPIPSCYCGMDPTEDRLSCGDGQPACMETP